MEKMNGMKVTKEIIFTTGRYDLKNKDQYHLKLPCKAVHQKMNAILPFHWGLN